LWYDFNVIKINGGKRMDYRRSFVDTAYDIVVKNGAELPFATLWNNVCEELGLTQEDRVARVSYFYTQLTLDGRFVTLGENVWDLRIRHTFDKVHIDMNEVYSEDEEELEFIPEDDDDIKDDVDRLTSEDEDDYEEDEEEDEE
jgi:DNA-directed RNA polymerase subunit delta